MKEIYFRHLERNRKIRCKDSDAPIDHNHGLDSNGGELLSDPGSY